MLEEMRIQDLGVIDEAALELSAGLNVVTGETGAGKTMVVTGLGLLFGERGDSARVRPGAERAVVEGRVRVDPEGTAAARAREAGAELDADSLVLSRSVSAEGRSRAHAGGRSAPIGLLSHLAEDLVALHGQADQHRLLQPGRQRGALDRYAGQAVGHALDRYRDVYSRHRAVSEQLTELATQARERAREADLLRFGVSEVEQVEPAPEEDLELAAVAKRLGHADALRGAATAAHDALLGDPARDDGADAVGLLGAARQAVEAVRDHDPELGALADRLHEAGSVLSDVATELATYAETVDADPERLAAVEKRRAVLAGLTRKYGADIDEVLSWARQGAQRLAELESDDERLDQLQAQQRELALELDKRGRELSAARAEAATALGAAVTAELSDLAMPHARVAVQVSQGEQPGPYGMDDVEIRLAAHPGAPSLPLQRGASGGELSRVMLAIEVVFAGADPVPTFVFDEVDAGVGGKAAVEVGRRLARLARHAQVVVVTHLPQVAAFADHHLAVEKSGDGMVNRSGVRALDDAGRLRELSRMLAGLEHSELGRAHAEELLSTAADAKSGR